MQQNKFICFVRACRVAGAKLRQPGKDLQDRDLLSFRPHAHLPGKAHCAHQRPLHSSNSDNSRLVLPFSSSVLLRSGKIRTNVSRFGRSCQRRVQKMTESSFIQSDAYIRT